ncbi:ArsR/SmtB family transcription factor [Salinispora pacifica]|uniref:ArsR/SmtB family transcription factor n=1 Tax=Salinispora pacifica TaxID=351187 RepID=UPI00037E1318|nr:ArsR family transcriptional regulator [Salinispora pacifica]
MDTEAVTGDGLLRALTALGNPHRLRVIAALVKRTTYVSELARELEISRPLLQVHLRKLESAGLVTSTLKLSDEGKAMKFYEVTDFSLHLTPAMIAEAAKTISGLTEEPGQAEKGNG